MPNLTNPHDLEFPPEFDFQQGFDLSLNFGNLRTASSSSVTTAPAATSPPEPLEPWADAPDVDAEYDDPGAEGEEPEDDGDYAIADTTVRASQITSFLGGLPQPVAPSAQVAQHDSSASAPGYFLPPAFIPPPSGPPPAFMPPPSGPLPAFMPPPSGPPAAMPLLPPVIGVMQSATVPAHGAPSQNGPDMLELQRRLTTPTHVVSTISVSVTG
jgi:hypothetical protein